tara:strand:+ start:139 stop:762 length:624 start_codon:yes stop_codon:yes gene_type:complete
MKYIYIFFFISLVSCGSTNQTYICGERKCIDKKEFKNYFAENLTVEVLEKKKDKKKTIDLVKLNTVILYEKKKITDTQKKESGISKKEKKLFLKAEKIRIKEEREIKKLEDKNKLLKLKKKIIKKETSFVNTIKDNHAQSGIVEKKTEKTSQVYENNNANNRPSIINLGKQKNISLCNKIIDCDIDKISELLTREGQKKDFPDITSK